MWYHTNNKERYRGTLISQTLPVYVFITDLIKIIDFIKSFKKKKALSITYTLQHDETLFFTAC